MLVSLVLLVVQEIPLDCAKATETMAQKAKIYNRAIIADNLVLDVVAHVTVASRTTVQKIFRLFARIFSFLLSPEALQ